MTKNFSHAIQCSRGPTIFLYHSCRMLLRTIQIENVIQGLQAFLSLPLVARSSASSGATFLLSSQGENVDLLTL